MPALLGKNAADLVVALRASVNRFSTSAGGAPGVADRGNSRDMRELMSGPFRGGARHEGPG